MALFIEIKAADGMVSRTKLDPGKNRFTVRLGDSYRIVDDQTGLTPAGLAVKRVDNSLLVDGLGAEDTTVEFAEFYSVCSAGSPCELTVDNGSGSAPVAITPGTQPIGALADGSFVLYDPNFAETAPAAPSMGDGTVLRNVLYGVGGLAIVGLAAGGGGGGGDGNGGGGGPRSDSALKLTSSEFVNSRTPNITGEGEPGARVTVRIDTDGDGSPNVTYGTMVGADFKWSVNLATAVPESGALPAGGLPGASNVGITATTSSGNASLPTFVLTFDGTPPAPAVIGVIAADDKISVSEKADGVIVGGTAEANSSIIVTWGSQSQSTVVDAQGGWQVAFAPANIGTDGPASISAIVTDRAGNISTAAGRKVTVDTVPVISPVTGDGAISLSEWAAGVAFAGTNPAGTRAGVDMTVTVGGVSKVVQTDAAGNWSALYSTGELPNAGSATVTAVASVGGVTGGTGTGSVSVSTLPTINTIAGDGVISLPERAAGVAVSGSTPAGTGAGVAISVSLGSTGKLAQTDAAGNWSALFRAAEIPVSGAVNAAAVVTVGAASGQAAAASASMNTTPALNAVTPDNVINRAELTVAGSAAISGAAPIGAPDGSHVIVTIGSLAPIAVPVAVGVWSLPLTATGIPAVDALYNVRVVGEIGGVTGAAITGAVGVDVTAPALGAIVAGDNIISQSELTTGFTVVGTSELGATVGAVTLGGVSKPVTTAANGTWATTAAYTLLDFPGLALDPDGPLQLVVTATDAARNPGQFTNSIPVQPPVPIAFAPPDLAATVDHGQVVLTPDLLGAGTLAATTDSSTTFVPQATGLSPLLQALEEPTSYSLG